jgi:ABC-type nitrate/sulfonate/bicarbonate transport system permease component
MALSAGASNVISGAILGGAAGLGYALVASPKQFRTQDMEHYGILFAAVGSVVGFFLIPQAAGVGVGAPPRALGSSKPHCACQV